MTVLMFFITCTWHLKHSTVQCVQKNDTKMLFVISSIKLWQFWWNFLHSFLNKFAAPEWCLYTTLWNLKCSSHTCCHWVVTGRNPRIYPTSTVASKFARFESSWLQHVRTVAGELYKICITDLDELKQRLWTEWVKLDHVVIVAAICQWRRR